AAKGHERDPASSAMRAAPVLAERPMPPVKSAPLKLAPATVPVLKSPPADEPEDEYEEEFESDNKTTDPPRLLRRGSEHHEGRVPGVPRQISRTAKTTVAAALGVAVVLGV